MCVLREGEMLEFICFSTALLSVDFNWLADSIVAGSHQCQGCSYKVRSTGLH